jgi:hypothetical protein
MASVGAAVTMMIMMMITMAFIDAPAAPPDPVPARG